MCIGRYSADNIGGEKYQTVVDNTNRGTIVVDEKGGNTTRGSLNNVVMNLNAVGQETLTVSISYASNNYAERTI